MLKKASSNNQIKSTKVQPKFGEIWMCNLDTDSGSVQHGYRPAFIVSNDKNNTHSRTVNIIPMTKTYTQNPQAHKSNKRTLPVHVNLQRYERFGLWEPSKLMVE